MEGILGSEKGTDDGSFGILMAALTLLKVEAEEVEHSEDEIWEQDMMKRNELKLEDLFVWFRMRSKGF